MKAAEGRAGEGRARAHVGSPHSLQGASPACPEEQHVSQPRFLLRPSCTVYPSRPLIPQSSFCTGTLPAKGRSSTQGSRRARHLSRFWTARSQPRPSHLLLEGSFSESLRDTHRAWTAP